MRELLVIIGVVLIALILWDGLRRMQKKGRYQDDYQDPDELRKQAELARELPNGGARVRTMANRDKTDLNTRLNLRERVPMLMDPVDEEAAADDAETVSHIDQQSLDFDAPIPEYRDEAESLSTDFQTDGDDVGDDDSDAEAIDDDFEAEPASVDSLEQEPHEADIPAEVEVAWDDDEGDRDPDWDDIPIRVDSPAEVAEQSDDRPVEELVIIHVMAPDSGTLAGSELLELLLRAGLRFGPMDIFHYRNQQGQLEFSLANCVQPGTLDPDGMAEMTTPGVTLFMQLPQRADLMTSFDHMVEMAQFLSQHLNADMLDENHSTVTPQRLEHFRERLRNFARSQLIQAHE